MTARITIRKPDDWHLHVRDGAMLKAVMPFTARHFGRAILMPNLVPPVITTKDAIAYRERVMAALPAGSTFTCYLTDDTDPNDVERGFREGVFTGVKPYPAHATTYSAAGVTDYRNVMPVLERMEKIGMPFLMHGEDVDPDVDIFDREAMIIERYLAQVGARHYRLPPNEDTITLEKSAWTAPPEVDIEGPDERALIYRGGETIEWKICA